MEGDALADYAVRPPKEWVDLDGRQQGALMKLLADGEVAGQLKLLIAGSAAGADPTAKPKTKKRDRNASQKNDAAATAAATAAVTDKATASSAEGLNGDGGAGTGATAELTRETDREPKREPKRRRRLDSPPPTAMVGDSNGAGPGSAGPRSNGGSVRGLDGDGSSGSDGERGGDDGVSTGAGQYSLDQYANFGMDDDNDGMFMSSLSAGAHQAAEPPQPKKKKNRPGQMARQK